MAAQGHPSVRSAGADGVYTEPTRRRIRAFVGGVPVADSTQAQLVWEHHRYPQYYLPSTDVRPGALVAAGGTVDRPPLGTATLFDLVVGGERRTAAAWSHPEARPEHLRTLVRFDWDAVDAWFEDDTEVFVHPKDPYVRVDILDVDRRIQVLAAGVEVASTDHARLLYETGLPPRLYLPRGAVDATRLVPTHSVTACPYKGRARYWSLDLGDGHVVDAVWGYDFPLPEAIRIQGMVSFYPQHVEVLLDGEPWTDLQS